MPGSCFRPGLLSSAAIFVVRVRLIVRGGFVGKAFVSRRGVVNASLSGIALVGCAWVVFVHAFAPGSVLFFVAGNSVLALSGDGGGPIVQPATPMQW